MKEIRSDRGRWDTVGKKFVTPPDDTIHVIINMRIYTLMSLTASLNPQNTDRWSSSASPASSSSLHTANSLSSGVSQVVVLGKFGRIKKAQIATKIVIAPSMI